MNLALVSPLPPIASPVAGLAASLVPHLVAGAGLRLLPHAPEQATVPTTGAWEGIPIEPSADLPMLLATGAVDLPVYLVADDKWHAHQVRFVREHPGLLVLLTPGVHRILAMLTVESGDLDGYRDLLVEEHGESARDWPERFLWRSDHDRLRDRLPMTGVLCRRSLGVLAPAPIARRLQDRNPDVPVEVLAAVDDPAAVASAILAMAARIVARPREIPPLPPVEWPSVEVVVVSYNSRAIIGPGLQSIAEQDYPNFRCTVVDNASSDDTAQFVRDNFPHVNVIQSAKNLGFAGGNNLAFSRSDARYVVMCNQDAIARRDFIRELVRVAERDQNVAAVGAKMLMMRCPTILNSTGVIVNEGGYGVDRDIGEKDVDPSPVPERVFAVSGGAQLIRTSVLREIGGFDEVFFMYCEDVDLCWRMRLRGHEVLYAPLAVVHHDWHGDLDTVDEPEQTGGYDERTERRRTMIERNRMQCVLKNLSCRNLLRSVSRLRKYDKQRYRALRQVPAASADLARMTERAIRGGNRWCLRHAPSILRRRRGVQRLRRVDDAEILAFLEPGVHEPSHVGDLSIINDRHSARAAPRLRMGVDEGRALGPGWHGLEPIPDQEYGLRWTKDRAWLYLRPDGNVNRLQIRVGRGPLETDLRITVGDVDLAPQPVPAGDLALLTFEMPHPLPGDAVVEVDLRCDSFRPSDTPGVEDGRTLGVRVAEVWLDSD